MAEAKRKKTVLWIWLSVLPLVAVVMLIVFGAFSDSPVLTTLNKSTGNSIFLGAIFLPFLIVFIIVFRAFKKPFMSFFGGDRETKRILTTGRSGWARVLEIGESSLGGTTTINDQPYLNLQLEIHDGNRPVYTASLDTIIPRAAVPRFQPDAVIPVKIDPENAEKIVIDWTGKSGSQGQAPESAPDGMPTVGNVNQWTDSDNRLLEDQGIKGTASILSVEDTGRSENFNPIVRMSYEVRVPHQDPYTFTKEVSLPTQAIQQIKGVIRRSFPARIHPHDRTKIKVDITF